MFYPQLIHRAAILDSQLRLLRASWTFCVGLPTSGCISEMENLTSDFYSCPERWGMIYSYRNKP